MKTCPFCAEDVQDAAIVCRYCGADLVAKTPRAPAPATPPPTVVVTRPAWSPGVAAVLSLVIPGAGQMYKGQVGAGIAWLIFVVLGYMAFILPGLILHLVCIVTAASGQPPPDVPVEGISPRAPSGASATIVSESLAESSHARRNLGILVGIGIIVALFAWGGPAADRPRPTASRSTAATVPTELPKSPEVAIERYGRPDEDYSAEHEVPRPPMVTRMLSYQAEHVRLVYMPVGYTFNMPPPYRDGWELVSALDSTTATKLSSQEAARRLAGRAR